MAISADPFRTDCVRAFTDKLISNLSQPKEELTQESCFDCAPPTAEDKVVLQRDVIEQQSSLTQHYFRPINPYKEKVLGWNDYWMTHVRYPGLAMIILDERRAERMQSALAVIRAVVQRDKFFFVKVPACFVLPLPGYKSTHPHSKDTQVLYVETRAISSLLSKSEQHEVVRRLFMHYTSQQAPSHFVENLKQAVTESISLFSKVEYSIRQKGPVFATDACFFHFHDFIDSTISDKGRRLGYFMRFFPDPKLLQGPMLLYSPSNFAKAQEKAKKYAVLFRTYDERKYSSATAPIATPQEGQITFTENEAIARSYILDEMQKTRESAHAHDQLFSSRCYRGLSSWQFKRAAINDIMSYPQIFSESLEKLRIAIDELMKTDHLRKQKNEDAEARKQSISDLQTFIQKVKGQKPNIPDIIYPLMAETLDKMKAEGTVIQWFSSVHKHDRTTEKLALGADGHIKYRIYF